MLFDVVFGSKLADGVANENLVDALFRSSDTRSWEDDLDVTNYLWWR